MAIYKCKMCGGTLEVQEGSSFCVCEFCGTQQTLPTSKDEGLQNLFNRANALRMKSEFDKAAETYEKIIQKNEQEAEAYWGLILCKYGVEYVEDPATYKRIPTCHRASFDAVTADEDYKNAIRYADVIQRGIYESEATAIEEIQKGILALAQKEAPYDVFICYKETDENGKRTQDSVIANDIYHQLTQEGFKVFYAAITLEDKLGTEYEPYIFSALISAKVMLSIGTRPEYFNAAWVKNEWSRFLKIMKKDRSKLLIPCYRDMDAYELPEEFAHLQAQDMSKIGFINDIVRGIKKVIVKDAPKAAVKETVVVQQAAGGTHGSAQIKRGNMALEDREWSKADDFFEEALNLDPECAEAYLGKMLARDRAANLSSWVINQKLKYEKANKPEGKKAGEADQKHIDQMAEECEVSGFLEKMEIESSYRFDFSYDSYVTDRTTQKADQESSLKYDKLFSRVNQYAKGETKTSADKAMNEIRETLQKRLDQAKQEEKDQINRIKKAYADHLAEVDAKVRKKSQEAAEQREQRYQQAASSFDKAKEITEFKAVIPMFQNLRGYKDSIQRIEQARQKIKQLEEEKEQEIRRQAELEKQKKRNKLILFSSLTAIVAAVVIVFFPVIKHGIDYNSAVALMKNEKYGEAIRALEAMNGYKDSPTLITQCFNLASVNPKVGDYIHFGSYEQDNNTSNGKEAIEWLVLAKEGSEVLLISRYALDAVRYNTRYTDTTWEKSSVRNWLNSTFLNAAFSSTEQSRIVTTAVTADKNPRYSTNPGNATKDQVFLLSINEVNQYFRSDKDRMCVSTAYAVSKEALSCWWWLRTPGNGSDRAAFVYYGGAVGYGGDFVASIYGCVRPALWINLNS